MTFFTFLYYTVLQQKKDHETMLHLVFFFMAPSNACEVMFLSLEHETSAQHNVTPKVYIGVGLGFRV